MILHFLNRRYISNNLQLYWGLVSANLRGRQNHSYSKKDHTNQVEFLFTENPHMAWASQLKRHSLLYYLIFNFCLFRKLVKLMRGKNII